VTLGRRRRSIGAQRALGRRRRSLDELDATLVGLVERVAPRLRSGCRVCRTVTLRMRFDDFSRATRSHTLPWPTSDTALLLTGLRRLLADATPLIESQGLTLIGVTLGNLDPVGAVQLELPFGAPGGVGVLDGAVDAVRAKFGSAALTRGVLIGRDPGLTVPLLPD
jgi:DNA polymerase-4